MEKMTGQQQPATHTSSGPAHLTSDKTGLPRKRKKEAAGESANTSFINGPNHSKMASFSVAKAVGTKAPLKTEEANNQVSRSMRARGQSTD